MEYLQYLFCKEAKNKVVEIEVLNLIINGIPSILWRKRG